LGLGGSEAGEVTFLSAGIAVKPLFTNTQSTTLLAMFNTPQLEGVAQEVEATIVKIMKKAALG